MSTSNSLSEKPPSNYKEALYWKISDKPGRLVMINLLSIPLAVVSGIGFFIFVHVFGKSPKLTVSGKAILIFLIGIIAVLALHEFVHGVVMRSFGAKPKYGLYLQGLMFYAKAPGYAFKHNQYLLILLSPFVSLSILACLGIVLLSGTPYVWILAMWGIVNASASNADVWITTILLRYPAFTYVVDERDGIRILIS